MAIFPAPVIAAPEPLRRRYGIFDAAAGPLDLPPHGDSAGVRYVDDTCGEVRLLGIDCYDPGDAPVKVFDGDNDETDTGVFATVASMTCTLVGYTQDQLEAKVLRRLEANEQAAVERALWSGLDFQGNALGNRTLAAEATLIGGNYEDALIADVVAALERYAYTEIGYGYAAYLHAPIEVAAWAAEAGLVHEERLTGGQSQRKVTPMGSIWSFGAYPPGQIIVTGQTTLYRGAVQLSTSFERTTNEALLLAERPWAVAFDCFAGSAQYDPLDEVSP